jgi:YfiH family protein
VFAPLAFNSSIGLWHFDYAVPNWLQYGFTGQYGPAGKAFDFRRHERNTNFEANQEYIQNQFKASALYMPKQVHGKKYLSISDLDRLPSIQEEADGSETGLTQLTLATLGADCLPILVYAEKSKRIAALHAGWRGLFQESLMHLLKEWEQGYRISADEVHVLAGPSISVNQYSVGTDLMTQFEKQHEQEYRDAFEIREREQIHLNIRKLLEIQCLKAGIPESQIRIANQCTFSDDNFYSARRNGIETGRNAGLIAIR